MQCRSGVTIRFFVYSSNSFSLVSFSDVQFTCKYFVGFYSMKYYIIIRCMFHDLAKCVIMTNGLFYVKKISILLSFSRINLHPLSQQLSAAYATSRAVIIQLAGMLPRLLR